MISTATGMLLLVKYLILTRREQKQHYQLTPSSMMWLHVITGSWGEHQSIGCPPSSPFMCSKSESTDISGYSHLPSHAKPHPRKAAGVVSGQVLSSLLFLTDFVLESILGVMGRKIELDLFKGFVNEFIHERLQGLSFPLAQASLNSTHLQPFLSKPGRYLPVASLPF